jgi:hypothetical protein
MGLLEKRERLPVLGLSGNRQECLGVQRLLKSAPLATKTGVEGAVVIMGFLVVICSLHLAESGYRTRAKLERASLIMCLRGTKYPPSLDG